MLWPLMLFATLSACDAAGPGFRGGEAVTREVEGSRFTLRFRGPLAEAVRTSPEWLPAFDATARRAALAAQAERPGCRVAWVQGDPAMMLVGLACGERPAPAIPARSRVLLCELIDWRTIGDWTAGALDCARF
ncbi:hypothetical protein [Citreimonas salinaria]|uniref:Uncharacterized protein n=1 Tax=Citreimonas salinaria TaxID=321339 RepID=A0A1H3FEN1_9RHOB|nr:hypothetical protein [Citreimonas salinaria]SDX89553.1 hypothetical protein SAMN05444340_101390 [Citreimonas salinaria]